MSSKPWETAGEILTRAVAVVETEAERVGADVTEAAVGRHHFFQQAFSEALGYSAPVVGAVNAVIAHQSLRCLCVADREHPRGLAGIEAEVRALEIVDDRFADRFVVVRKHAAVFPNELQRTGFIELRRTRGSFVHADLRLIEARQHDVVVDDRIGIAPSGREEILELPVLPHALIGHALDQRGKCGLDHLLVVRQRVCCIRRERLAEEGQLISKTRTAVVLLAPVEPFELIGRLQRQFVTPRQQLAIERVGFQRGV